MPFPAKYETTVSVPLPSDEEIRKVIGESYNPATALNVVKMIAGTDDMYAGTIGLVKAVFAAKGIDPRTREMIILRAAKVLNAPYEWQANTAMAKNTGLTQTEIDATAGDGPVTLDNKEYVLVCKATDEMCEEGTLTDDTLTALLSHFGQTDCRKIILIISWFNLLSLFLNGCRVPLETIDKIGEKTSPLG